MSAGQEQRKRSRIIARTLGRVVLGIVLIALAGVMLLSYLVLRGDIDAPDWVRNRVEIAIAQSVPGAELEFDDLQFRLETDGQPVVQMRNAVLHGPDGERIFELSDMQAVLSFKGLLTGDALPRRLVMSGLFLDVTREPNGSVALDFDQGQRISSAGGAGIVASVLVALDNPALAELAAVEIDAITVSYEDQRVRRSWTVDGGRLRIAVTEEAAEISGDFALLSGRDSAATVEANSRLSRTGSGATFGISVSDIPAADLATQQASLAWLSVLDAPISGSIRGGVEADGGLMPISTALKIGAGSVKPNEATKGVPFRSAGAYFSYNPETQLLSFDEVSVDSDWLAGRSDGIAAIVLRQDGLPDGFEAVFEFSDLHSATNGLWGHNVVFENPTVEFGMRTEPFELTLHSATLGYEGAELSVEGQLHGGAEGWDYQLFGALPELSHDQLMMLWPEGRSEKTRIWLEKNVDGAGYRNAFFNLSAEPGQKAAFGLETDLAGATIRYAKDLSPGVDVSGHVSLQDKKLTAEVVSGRIYPLQAEGLDAAGTVFSVGDVSDKSGNALVRIKGEGALASVLELLEQIPGLSADDTDLRNLANGHAQFSGALAFPIGRVPLPSEYRYSINGKATEVVSDSLVPNQTLTADELSVNATNESILIQGPAKIGGVEINAGWNSAQSADDGSSALTGLIEISQDFVHEFGLGLPDGMVNGEGVGALHVELPKGEDPRFELTSELRGVGLDLGFVGWQKSQSTSGKLVATGSLGNPVAIENIEISASGFSAKGSIELLDDGSLDSVEFHEMKIAEWLDGSVRIQGNGQGVAPDIHITGGRVDVQALTEATGGIGATGGNSVEGRLFTELDELFVSDFLSLQNLSGGFDLGNNMQGTFSGRLNDTVDIAGAISSDAEGRRRISISADDAGKVFSALGLLDRASQGNMLVELVEKSQGYSGSFVARDLRLLDMPLFADLLNAISVVGLLDQLEFDGIAFGEVDGEFYFSEDKFILTRASATGPSIGLSLDGTYDFVNDNLDLQGTLTPVFLVNGIGGIFNRKGEGLIGFTFDVKGPADNPKITVNPFSALAPSLFRDIFRKAAPEAPE